MSPITQVTVPKTVVINYIPFAVMTPEVRREAVREVVRALHTWAYTA